MGEKMFSIRMVGVEPENRGQGVATNLIRRSILLAGCLGFRAIKAEATGRFSKETFEKVGMIPGSSIKYADFTYEGEKVFEGLSKEDKEITFMKKILPVGPETYSVKQIIRRIAKKIFLP